MSNNPEFFLNDPQALSAVLTHLELGAEVYKDGDYCGTWAVDTAGSRRIPFHLIGLARLGCMSMISLPSCHRVISFLFRTMGGILSPTPAHLINANSRS
jgi:hypothetical protein